MLTTESLELRKSGIKRVCPGVNGGGGEFIEWIVVVLK